MADIAVLGRFTMKKQILLTALTLTLLASAVMTAAAEEVVATILFEPALMTVGAMYSLDTDDDLVTDMHLRIPMPHSLNDIKIYSVLWNYLKEGRQVEFENDGLDGRLFINDRLLAIIANGRRIELTQLFSREEITSNFPYLDKKLRAGSATVSATTNP